MNLSRPGLDILLYLTEYSWVTEYVFPRRSKRETSQGAYTFQIFLEKEQMGQIPTVQQLMDTSCLSGDLKFETVSPSLTRSESVFNKFSSVQSLILFLCPSDAVLSNSSDAEVWKQIQDVFSHYSLLEAGHHRSPIQLWGAVISSTFLKIALKESLIMLRIICFVQQLRGSALFVGVWQSTSVFSVCQIANCSQGESNSTVPPVMHR